MLQKYLIITQNWLWFIWSMTKSLTQVMEEWLYGYFILPEGKRKWSTWKILQNIKPFLHQSDFQISESTVQTMCLFCVSSSSAIFCLSFSALTRVIIRQWSLCLDTLNNGRRMGKWLNKDQGLCEDRVQY